MKRRLRFYDILLHDDRRRRRGPILGMASTGAKPSANATKNSNHLPLSVVACRSSGKESVEGAWQAVPGSAAFGWLNSFT